MPWDKVVEAAQGGRRADLLRLVGRGILARPPPSRFREANTASRSNVVTGDRIANIGKVVAEASSEDRHDRRAADRRRRAEIAARCEGALRAAATGASRIHDKLDPKLSKSRRKATRPTAIWSPSTATRPASSTTRRRCRPRRRPGRSSPPGSTPIPASSPSTIRRRAAPARPSCRRRSSTSSATTAQLCRRHRGRRGEDRRLAEGLGLVQRQRGQVHHHRVEQRFDRPREPGRGDDGGGVGRRHRRLARQGHALQAREALHSRARHAGRRRQPRHPGQCAAQGGGDAVRRLSDRARRCRSS